MGANVGRQRKKIWFCLESVSSYPTCDTESSRTVLLIRYEEILLLGSSYRHVDTPSNVCDLKLSSACVGEVYEWTLCSPALGIWQLHRKSAELCGGSAAVMKGMFLCHSGKQTSDIGRLSVLQLHLPR